MAATLDSVSVVHPDFTYTCTCYGRELDRLNGALPTIQEDLEAPPSKEYSDEQPKHHRKRLGVLLCCCLLLLVAIALSVTLVLVDLDGNSSTTLANIDQSNAERPGAFSLVNTSSASTFSARQPVASVTTTRSGSNSTTTTPVAPTTNLTTTTTTTSTTTTTPMSSIAAPLPTTTTVSSLSNITLGTQLYPATTCSTLHQSNSSLPDGLYWVDPNMGNSSDAVQVMCNMTAGGWTGVAPTFSVPFGFYNPSSGTNVYVNFTDTVNGTALTYAMPQVQLQALVALSTDGLQDIAWQCHHTIMYSYQNKYDYAARWQAQQGYQWTYQSTGPYNMTVIDTCYLNDLVDRDGAAALRGPADGFPIVDFEVRDWDRTFEQLGVKMSSAWFK